MLVENVRKSESKNRSKSLESKAGIGARIEMLSTHALHLGVEGFNVFAVEAQVVIVSPSVRGHIFATSGNQADIERLEKRGGIRRRDIALEPGAVRQDQGQFVDGCQVLVSRR